MIINTLVSTINAMNRQKGVVMNKGKASQRLSSGYKINSAADDAAGLAISEKMRAQIRGLEQAERNISDGIKLYRTGDGALAEINNMLVRIKELAVQSCNDTNEDEDRQKIDDEMQQLLDEIDALADKTEFNKNKILKADDPIVSRYTNTITTTVTTDIKVYNALVGTSGNNLESATARSRLLNCRFPVSNTSTATNRDVTTFTINGSTATRYAFDVGYWVLHETPGFDVFIQNMYELDGSVTDVNKQKFVDALVKGLNAGFQSMNAPVPTLYGGYTAAGDMFFGFNDPGYRITAMSCSNAYTTSLGHGFMHLMFNPSTTSPEAQVSSTHTESSDIGREEIRWPMKKMWLQTGPNAGNGRIYSWNTLCVEQLGLSGAGLRSLKQAKKTLAIIDVNVNSI